MFYGCSSLIATPELPASILLYQCYRHMFQNCTSLITANEMSFTSFDVSNAPSNEYDMCRHMFQGCTKLKNIQNKLYPTILAKNCYAMMFYECTSLETAPELPATTLVNSCYYQMFYNCTILTYIKCLATNISASNCTDNWGTNLSRQGQFIVPNSMRSTWDAKSSGSGKPINFEYVDVD